MDRTLLRDFWNCGDTQIVDYAMIRARLNHHERMTVTLIMDKCATQEQAAEFLGVSTRCLQTWWYSAADKLLSLPWVVAYAKEMRANPP